MRVALIAAGGEGTRFGAEVPKQYVEVLGKPLGIISVTYLLVKIGFASLPDHVSWSQIIAVGIMGGMGFTMSILISSLAFADPAEVLAAKCAILAGSVVAGGAGLIFVSVHDKIKARR